MSEAGHWKNQHYLAFVLIILIIIPSILIATQIGSDTYGPKEADFFSIMQITDTQYISWKDPSLFYDLTEWIVSNSAKYNLKMVIHTGDLVDTPTHTSEWEVANTAMMTLYDNGIPYCWNAGNHDQLPPNETANLWLGDSNSDWLGSQYRAFDQIAMRKQPYWVSDIFNGKNTAVAFNYSKYPFMVINLEFLANSSTIDWMRSLIENNPESNIIVATHDYLNRTGGYGSFSISNQGVLDFNWGNDFRAILDNYPSVFLTLSGHVQSNTTGAFNHEVNNRQEIFFNRQEINNKFGAASVRIYTFDLTKLQVSVSTFALDKQSWVTDERNLFNSTVELRQSTAPEFHSILALILLVFLASCLLLFLRRKRSISRPFNSLRLNTIIVQFSFNHTFR